jgi:hypothetical protein
MRGSDNVKRLLPSLVVDDGPKFSRGSHAGGTVGLQMRCLRHEY